MAEIQQQVVALLTLLGGDDDEVQAGLDLAHEIGTDLVIVALAALVSGVFQGLEAMGATDVLGQFGLRVAQDEA